jgi:ParB family chromosome partitioning protein
MEKKTERKGLGRGLSALMADVNLTSSDGQGEDRPRLEPEAQLPIEVIHPNPHQPRRDFDPAALDELADSIRAKGIIQPIVVRRRPDGASYEIIAGERRWRAAQIAQLHRVPVVVRDMNDDEVIEVAIIENIQRENLNAVEEALGFRQLMDRFGHTQEKLAQALAKSRSHIANTLRLLNLPDEVQQMIRAGKLTAGHARALVGASDPTALAIKIANNGLSVREAEKLAMAEVTRAGKRQARSGQPEKDADTRAIESDLSANLGMAVTIDHAGPDEGGTLRIRYRSLDQLDMLCQVLSVTPRDFKP